jgi:hypothetical protein
MRKFLKLTSAGFIALALLLIASPATEAKAQYWAASGNNIYNTNSGNVGIGTSTPQTKLNLSVGTGQFSGVRQDFSDPSQGAQFTAYEAGTLKGGINWIGSNFSDTNRRNDLELINTVNSSNADITFWTNYLGANTVKMTITNSGKVGIGTTSPSTTLYVAGTVWAWCSSGEVTTQSITNANQWYTLAETFDGCTFPTPPKIILTQDNTGSGDISIISFKVRKNTVTTTGFSIDFYVNAVPAAGTTTFRWMAISN